MVREHILHVFNVLKFFFLFFSFFFFLMDWDRANLVECSKSTLKKNVQPYVVKGDMLYNIFIWLLALLRFFMYLLIF